MENRVKKFWKEHETAIIVTGVVVSFLYITGRIIDDQSIKSADIFTRDDGKQAIVVFLKNGTTVTLKKELTE